MAAVDMLSMLVEVVPQILSLYPRLPTRITQALCYAIAGEFSVLCLGVHLKGGGG